MEFLRNTALCLIAAAAAGTLATVIVPRGSMDKTLRAAVGIFVVAVICSPFAEISEYVQIEDAFASLSEVSTDESYTEDMKKRMLEIFESAIKTDIEEIASQLNIDVVSVETDTDFDEDCCINIHKIVVKINGCESSEKEYLSVKISENLGVPAEVIAE